MPSPVPEIRGVRILFVNEEIDNGDYMNIGMLKTLTGNDVVRDRQLYDENE